MRARPATLLLLLAACSPRDLPDSAVLDDVAAPGEATLAGPGARATLGWDGLTIEAGSDQLGLTTEAWGREGSTEIQAATAPRDGGCWDFGRSRLARLDCDPTVERPLSGGAERWRRAGQGVQQAWELDTAPEGVGAVQIDVRVTGATPVLDGTQVVLTTPAGNRWTYAGLQAWDTNGAVLNAWMAVDDDIIQVFVDDTDAVWPITVDPVVSTASTTLTQTSTDFGIGVTMGNFNGGSYGDVAVGARFGTGLYGEAFTYHGSSSGVSTTYARKLTGADYYGKFGEYVDGDGDVNGDGYTDLVVCEFYSERFMVYHGSSSGIGSTANTTVTGVYGLGRGLATADWNNDGYDDVMAGAQEPTAEVYRGSSSGLNTTRYYTTATLSEAPSVATAGDVNNDGYEEFIYGVAGTNAAYVLMGGSSPPASTKTLTRSGSSEFGFAVGGGGDIDGDGYDDVIVGDPTYSSSTGRVTVFWGSSSGLSTSDYTVLSAPSSGTGFGYTVEVVGDVNGDGYDDIAVSDDYDNSNAYIFHGSSSGISSTAANTLNIGDANFAYDIAGGQDVNADGYDDVVFGSIGSYAYVYHGCADADGDGECADLDCDDTDATVNTSATEVCDDVDNDCDGYTDDADTGVSGRSTWYRDADSDNYGVTTTTTTACDQPSGYAALSTDCNDSSASINPGATETTGDGIDSNCDSRETCYVDADNDTYRLSTTVSSTDSDCSDSGEALSTDATGDCNDSSASINPGATETTGDGVDSNCDNVETCYADADDDAYRTTSTVSSTDSDCSDSGEALSTDTSGDCDDTDSAIHPGATEVCDGDDNDCDGLTDGADSGVDTSTQTRYYDDDDSDGYGDASDSTLSCSVPTGYVTNDDDCNDLSASINPGATETAGDGVDGNCDGTETCYVDADNDAYRLGTTLTSTDSDCSDSGEALSTDASGDCDDTSSAVHPGATDVTGDGVDSDCSGAETCYADADDDGYRTTSTVTSSDGDCSDAGEALSTETSGDCDDADGAIHPGATEVCDGDDNDCDGLTDSSDPGVDGSTETTWYDDDDGDGYGDASDTTESCDAPLGYVIDATDCDDTVAGTHPGATDAVGDGVDSDCDGAEDCYVDADGDNYRLSTTLTSSDGDCADSGEALGSDPSGDCDDTDSAINPGATDTTADGIDSDCDGTELCYTDTDGDSFRGTSTTTSSDGDCSDSGEALSSVTSGDCDDANAAINPDAAEVCDGSDNDCDGLTDTADPSNDNTTTATWYADADGDGYGLSSDSVQSCDTPAGYAILDGDCDDAAAGSYPGAADTLADGIDSDCDGLETCYEDLDDDSYRTDVTTVATDGDCDDAGEALVTDAADDCDDTSSDIYPGAPDPAYDDIDQACDGDTNDQDGDGHDAEAAGGDDCDDTDASVHAGAEETWYDGVDADCAGDDDYDADADGEAAEGYGGDDCDDFDADVNSSATDTWYDGVDSDCGGNSDYDQDADGHDAESGGGDDCDDEDATIYAGAEELMDGLDNDCDGHDETYDGDEDGLTDLEEAELGTDPTNPDTDGGSVGDGEEVERGSDPLDGDDDLPLAYVKSGGCACSTASDFPNFSWLVALAPLALARRSRRTEAR